jgi:hypothetical protein
MVIWQLYYGPKDGTFAEAHFLFSTATYLTLWWNQWMPMGKEARAWSSTLTTVCNRYVAIRPPLLSTWRHYSMVLVRKRTIPTERPPVVGEVITNFCGYRVSRGQCDGSLRPYSRFSRQKPLLFYRVAPQLYSRGWVDPVPDPLLFSGSAGNRTRASGSVAKNSDH